MNPTISVNQIYKTYVVPKTPGVPMSQWLDAEKELHWTYMEKGGRMMLESWLRKKYVGLENLAKDKTEAKAAVDGSEKPAEPGTGTSTFWSRNKKWIAWTVILTPVVYIGWQVFKPEAKK